MCLRNSGWFAWFAMGKDKVSSIMLVCRLLGDTSKGGCSPPLLLVCTQEVGCVLTSSFWAWKEQEEQKQRGDGLSTQSAEPLSTANFPNH